MFRFFGALSFVLIFKQMNKIFQRLFFSFVDLVWVYVVLSGNQRNALVFAQCFQDDLRLLTGCESFSFGHVFLQKLHLNYARFRV